MANGWVQKRRIGAAMAGLIVLAACGTSSSEAPTTTDPITTATTTQTTTTTTEPTTTSTAAPDTTETTVDSGILLPEPIADPESLTAIDAPAPEVNLEAETWVDFLLAWEQIDAYWTWLRAHPDAPSGDLDAIFVAGGDAFANQESVLSGLVDQGWRIVADSTFGEITAFGCCPDPDQEMQSGSLTVTIQTRSDDPAAQIVNADGSVQELVQGWDFRELTVVFRQVDGKGWLVFSFE